MLALIPFYEVISPREHMPIEVQIFRGRNKPQGQYMSPLRRVSTRVNTASDWLHTCKAQNVPRARDRVVVTI